MTCRHIIRTAKIKDLPIIYSLLSNENLTIAGIKENLPNFFVADYNGVVGVIGLEFDNEAVMLRSMVIDKKFRKRGIATGLVNYALDLSRQNGVKAAYILTNTAEKFALRWGFTKIGRNEIPASLIDGSELKNGCPASSICMKLELS